jgi:hypothetical protein
MALSPTGSWMSNALMTSFALKGWILMLLQELLTRTPDALVPLPNRLAVLIQMSLPPPLLETLSQSLPLSNVNFFMTMKDV